MTSYEYMDQVSIALAPIVREHFDFSDEAGHTKAFVDQVWRLSEALSKKRDEVIKARPVVVPCCTTGQDFKVVREHNTKMSETVGTLHGEVAL